MKIKGIIDVSTNEWKDHVSMVIFFHGCPLKCNYCQNYSEEHFDISIDSVIDRIKFNAPFIDSIVISGGEPLEQFEELIKILRFSKKIGLKTAIETSGILPLRLKYLIEDKFLDMVFLDIKGNSKITNHPTSFINSIACLHFSEKVNMEVRTTLFRTFPDIEQIVKIIKPYKINVLQQGCPENSKDIPECEKLTREEIITIAKKYDIKIIRTKVFGETWI